MKAKEKTWIAALAAIGTFLAGVAAVSGAIHLPARGSESINVSVAVFDTTGVPATGTFLVFQDGQRFEPNLDGVYVIPGGRAGQEASLREQVTRRELCRVMIPSRRSEFRRVTLPRARGGSC